MEENRLAQAREMIRKADREMADLFLKRMEAVREIAAYKRERGLPILDAGQEQTVIRRSQEWISAPEMQDLYVSFLRGVMDVSKTYQRRLMEGVRVAYSGVEGAFAHIAVRRIFPEAAPVSCLDFQSAYEAVERGECDLCVLPVENSYAGEVGQVTDLLFTGSLHVTGMYSIPVVQNLVGLPGSTPEQIRKVISHPQALSQCAAYLRRKGFETEQASNTARAAQSVAQRGEPTLAAIAARETAGLYGLSILAEHINESNLNETRFAVFSRAENRELPAKAAGFLLMFTVHHTAGSLAGAVSVIGRHGFNMRVLRSRPMKDLPWNYYFFAEIEGDDRSEEGRGMLRELERHCAYLKVAGRFGPEVHLKETN